jgi:hypothetical protein
VFCINIVVVVTVIITALWIKLSPIHGSQCAEFNSRTTQLGVCQWWPFLYK